MPVPPNVLAQRYASDEMVHLFDPVTRISLEREFWVAVMKAQKSLGLDIPSEAIEAYERVVHQVDLDSIHERERISRHDVKARIDEFSALAGYEHAHKGMTSRDLTENVEAVINYRALNLVRERVVALLAQWAALAATFSDTVIVGRTHNVPAQPTTVGKRFAQFGEELLGGLAGLDGIRQRFAIRGIKGPVGSQQDQVDLLGSAESANRLDGLIAEHLGIPSVHGAVGQVYPRSRDFEVIACLAQMASGPANLALLIRLMAGHDLATEGFAKGQVGSSAMPHKMNTRTCERINGLQIILNGHLAMAAGLNGSQWNEGDVSCSVVRRIMIPDAFFAFDGVLESSFAVGREFGVFNHVIEAELQKYLPFLATPTLLMHAVRNGMGREEAHERIKGEAMQAALDLRNAKGTGQLLIDRLGDAPDFPGSRSELLALTGDASNLTGLVGEQTAEFCKRVEELATAVGPAANYRGADIL